MMVNALYYSTEDRKCFDGSQKQLKQCFFWGPVWIRYPFVISRDSERRGSSLMWFTNSRRGCLLKRPLESAVGPRKTADSSPTSLTETQLEWAGTEVLLLISLPQHLENNVWIYFLFIFYNKWSFWLWILQFESLRLYGLARMLWGKVY